MEKGTLVEFQAQGDRQLAVIDRPDGKKNLIAIGSDGRKHSLHPRQIAYVVSGDSYQPTAIAGFLKDVEAYIDPTALEVAWELTVEEGGALTPQTLAELLFSESTAVSCYAAHCLLAEDKVFFKQKGDRYEPRPASQVADLQHQLMAEAQRRQEWEEFLERAQQALDGISVEWRESDRPRLDTLEKLAEKPVTPGSDTSGHTVASEILTALKRPTTSQGAFQILVDLGLWSPHENLFIKQRQVPTRFSEKVLDMAHRLLDNPPPDSCEDRLDLTHLKVCTIDDESTQEIDDGLSIEFLEDGRQKIWIHIADPTRWIQPGDVLDLEARRRSTTLYLPTGMIPMFPPELATGSMSLVQGQICCALSFGVMLTDEGAIETSTICPTLIRPTYRLTYEDVDELLQLGVTAEPELEAIAAWAKKRQLWRQSQGSISIQMPESQIKVRNDEITISLLDISQARQMVAEMMILAGEVTGRYGQEHELPLPYRGQPQPELPSEEELMILPAGPVRDCAVRSCMSRSEMGTTPLRHAGLGLNHYTQVTSPIRRYTDLITHFQLKAYLRGDELPFSAETLTELVQAVTSTAYEAVSVERQTNRYWGIEFLRRQEDQIWQGLMLRWWREHENLALILLEDLGLELKIQLTHHAAFVSGDRLDLKLAYADPRQDIIQFSALSEPAA
ncbi:MAG: ribonuclease R family protein [Elainellaceae cyanobacterium]